MNITLSNSAFFHTAYDLVWDNTERNKTLPPGQKYGALHISMLYRNEYAKLRQTTPVEGVPDVPGATEENLEWLKAHYAGDLSTMEKMEVFDVLHSMGIADKNILDQAMDLDGLTRITWDDLRNGRASAPFMSSQHDSPSEKRFLNSALFQLKDLDDILSWLERETDACIDGWQADR